MFAALLVLAAVIRIGVVLNAVGAEGDLSRSSNAALIEQFADVPVLGQTPWLEGELSAGRLRSLVLQHVDVDFLERRSLAAPAGGLA